MIDKVWETDHSTYQLSFKVPIFVVWNFYTSVMFLQLMLKVNIINGPETLSV